MVPSAWGMASRVPRMDLSSRRSLSRMPIAISFLALQRLFEFHEALLDLLGLLDPALKLQEADLDLRKKPPVRIANPLANRTFSVSKNNNSGSTKNANASRSVSGR